MKTGIKITAMCLAAVITYSAFPPVPAMAQTLDLSPLVSQVETSYGHFKELGFDYQTLSKVLHTEVSTEDFWGNQATSYTLSDAQEDVLLELGSQLKCPDFTGVPDQPLQAVPRDGDPYDGNPPYSTSEQMERLNYLLGVYDRYYSNPKYNMDLYLSNRYY